MVGVQMGQQHVNGVRIRMTLQGAEDTTPEVENQGRGVGRGDEISGRGRIRTDHTAGTTEYGDSHAH